MDADSKAYLRDAAAMSALDKAVALRTVSRLLGLCYKALDDHLVYCYATDRPPDEHPIRELREKIFKIQMYEIPDYFDEVVRSLLSVEPEDYDYFGAGRYDDARREEMKSRGIEFDEDSDDYDELPHEDPLKLFERLRTSHEVETARVREHAREAEETLEDAKRVLSDISADADGHLGWPTSLDDGTTTKLRTRLGLRLNKFLAKIFPYREAPPPCETCKGEGTHESMTCQACGGDGV